MDACIGGSVHSRVRPIVHRDLCMRVCAQIIIA